jgi:RNase adapter protein RapZ
LSVKSVDPKRALVDAIEHERELLAELRERALVIDTSLIRPARLRSQVKDMVGTHHAPMTLVFESFAFKRGIPMDADFVFDVRMLPNPHYEPELKALTGLDAPVASFLDAHDEVHQMQTHISDFLTHWLPRMLQDHRSYVTVGIGCTGGQHRSVYLVEALAKTFGSKWNTRVRHRESDHWTPHSG